jgi:hypothetical protein
MEPLAFEPVPSQIAETIMDAAKTKPAARS